MRSRLLIVCAGCQQAPPTVAGRCDVCAHLAGLMAPHVEPVAVVWRPFPPKHEVDRKLSRWIAAQRRGQAK